MKRVGTRVILNTLLRRGDFTGEIITIDEWDLCSVKLDNQDTPVLGVLWYDERPEVINSPLWQICFPLEEEL